MADWEGHTGAPSRGRRGVLKSDLHQSRVELLQAIAARRKAQKAPSPPPDAVYSQRGEHLIAEAKMAASKLLPESSEASGTSGDEGSVDVTNSSSTGTRKSFKASTEEELSNVLNNMSIKEMIGPQTSDAPRVSSVRYQHKPKDTILDIRKRLVKKSTPVESESDSEDDNFVSPNPAVSSQSVDYTSADDGDVDSPVVTKVKSKARQGSLPTSALSSLQVDQISDDDEDNVFDLRIKSQARESVSATTTQPQHPPLVKAANEEDNTGIEEDMRLVEGKHRFILRAKVATMLYPHQRAGIKWLWGLHTKGMGGILGDDMGLGKTMQIASFLAGLFCSQNIKCALIVAPKTLIAHWVKELKVVGLGRKTQDYSGTSAKARDFALHHVLQMGGVLLTTYDMVRCNYKALRGDFAGRDGYGDTSEDIVTWDYMILDEGHLVKNPNTQRAKSLREVPAAHRIVLSGTPLQNHLQEMWALFDFSCPDLLGDRKEFRDKYERQILAGTDKNASDRQKRIGLAVAEELRQKFRPFFLRRLKSEVFPDSDDKEDRKLSRKNDLIVWLPLSERQQKLYRAFLNSDTAEETWNTGRKVLAALTVMKKICDHPTLLTKKAANDIAEGMEGILDKEDIAAAEAMTESLAGMAEEDENMGAPSCKIVFLMALLENLVEEGHRTLIFAQTRKMLNIIQDEILERNWCFRRIDGTIKAPEREQCVQEFQTDDDIPLFLLTSQVGGLGLTLTGADRVVIVDPAWNPSTDNQSVDRAYRIGQKNDVVVYRLMTCGTIEEKIYRKQVFKGHLMKVATEKKNQMRYFAQEELGDMFRVPETGFNVSLTQKQLHKEHFSQHKIDDSLQQHIEFLDGLGIAGVSHHDLLFTKEAEPLPPAAPEEQDLKATWEPRNPSYVGQRFKPASKQEKHVWDASHARQGVLASAHAGLQVQSLENDRWLKVQFLRSKLERLSRTFDDKATLSRLPDKGANIDKKIRDTLAELRETEYLAGSKENIDVSLPSRPVAPIPVVDLSPPSTGTGPASIPVVDLSPPILGTGYRIPARQEPGIPQRPKPLGSNNITPTVVNRPLPIKPITCLSSHPATPRSAKPGVDMPSWSLLSDSPSSSRDSPAPTSRADFDDMAEALSSLNLRPH